MWSNLEVYESINADCFRYQALQRAYLPSHPAWMNENVSTQYICRRLDALRPHNSDKPGEVQGLRLQKHKSFFTCSELADVGLHLRLHAHVHLCIVADVQFTHAYLYAPLCLE